MLPENEKHEGRIDEEPKDRTKWMWLGVLALFAILVVVLLLTHRRERDATEVRAKHILIKFNANDAVDRARALELITDLRTRIGNGESFARLAKEFSNDGFSSPRGGDLGYYPKGDFEGEFERYVWIAPVGELSDVIQTSHGFHLVVVTDRRLSKADQYEMELERKAAEGQSSGTADSEPGSSTATEP